jgi:glycosyltransferase involved in cell wall biosynthesis
LTPRVLHVISTAGPHPWFRTLIEDGHADPQSLLIGCVGPSGALQDDMRELGVQSFALGATPRAALPAATVRLAQLLRRVRPDVVQTHLVEGSLVGLTAARLAQIPVAIMTAHHSHELPFHGRRLRWPDALCAGPLSDHIIAPSDNVADTIVRELSVRRDKIDVIHHGFDLSGLDPTKVSGAAVRTELGLGGKLVLGAIGRLYWIKNQDALVRAFAQADVDGTLVLVGPGDRAPLERLAETLGVGDRVRVIGPRSDIRELLASFDAFLHPAIAESFGMVIIEAMAMGLPIMSTAVGIAPDVIGHEQGVLAASPSVLDLKRALTELVERRGVWPAMGVAARTTARDFTAERMA